MADDVETFQPETLLLGTSPVAFVDAVINAVNDYAYDASEQLLQTLLNADRELDPVALRRAVNKLLNFIQDQVDKYYDRFELFCLSNVLRVPPHVPLPTDLPSGEAAATPERVAELRGEQKALLEKLQEVMAKREAQERELATLRARKASEGPASDMTREVTAACKRSGVSGAAEYVSMITADIEAVTRYCDEATKNARGVARATASEEPSQAFKRRRAEVTSSALADVANSFRRK